MEQYKKSGPLEKLYYLYNSMTQDGNVSSSYLDEIDKIFLCFQIKTSRLSDDELLQLCQKIDKKLEII